MALNHILHAYVDIVCLIILVFVFYRMRSALYQGERIRAFARVVLNVIIILALDAVAIMVSGVFYPVSIVVNATFLAWMGIAGYSLLRFTEISLGSTQISPAGLVIRMVPAIVLAVFCYASIWTGWAFSVDPQTVLYSRGPLHFVQVLLAGVYLVVPAGMVIAELLSKPSAQRRSELLTLLAIFVLPVVGSVLGVAFYGIPFTWTLCAVCVVMVFANFQEYSISTDSLTGLSNRRQLDAYIRDRMEDEDYSYTHMGLLLMDIDRFKSINDTYGHYSGDEALVEIATLLKRIVGGRRLLISRYGGDEFLIAGDFIGDEDEHGLKRQILEVVAQHNRTTKTPYPLMLSIGTAHMDKGCTLTFDQMIALADVELYAEKVAHNAEIR